MHCCTLDRIKPPVIFSSPSQTAAKENSSSHASNSRVSPSDKLDRSPSSNGEHLSQGSDVPARVKGTQETQLPPLLSSGEWDEAAAELLLRVSGEKQLVVLSLSVMVSIYRVKYDNGNLLKFGIL